MQVNIRRRTHTEESVEDRYTREEEEGTTENKMGRRVPTRLEQYWTESGQEDGRHEAWRASVMPATIYGGTSEGK